MSGFIRRNQTEATGDEYSVCYGPRSQDSARNNTSRQRLSISAQDESSDNETGQALVLPALLAPGRLLLLIEAVLDGHSVRYKQLAPNTMAQAPSQRLISGSYVFPGSKSEYNHELFLQENQQRPIVLAVAYSKNAIYGGIDAAAKDKVLMKVLELNAGDPVGFWKLEERPGSVFPVLEMTLYSSQSDDSVKEYIWKTCGTLDAVFKAKRSNLSPALVADQAEVERRVKGFLEVSGFRKIKEPAIPNGHCFLVALSCDDEPEETRWKRFPLKIDVTGILAFRIYFSLDNTAVTAKGHFSNSAKSFIAKLNPMLEVGYFNYASNSNQIQCTLKLHYKTLSPADLAASLKSYYDTVILCYKWTAPSLAALHSKTQNLKVSLSDVSEYVSLASDQIKSEYYWRVVRNLPLERRDLFLRTLQTVSEKLGPHLLKPPIYKVNLKGVFVKFSSRLSSLKCAVSEPAHIKDRLMKTLLGLIAPCTNANTYPTHSELFYDASYALLIIPSRKIHADKPKFLAMIQTCFCKILSLSEKSRSTPLEDAPRIAFESLDISMPQGAEWVLSASYGLGTERCHLYKIYSNPTSEEFNLIYNIYKAELETLSLYPNPFLGIMRGTELVFEAASADQCVDYLCEAGNYLIWKGNSPSSSLLQLASFLHALHADKRCHWFVSPFTIRLQRHTGKVFPVLPCLTPAFSSLVSSFIAPAYKSYIAPEVQKYITDGTPVVHPAAADVYSLCQLILHMTKKDIRLEKIGALVTLGTSEDWGNRPTLDKILPKLREIQPERETPR